MCVESSSENWNVQEQGMLSNDSLMNQSPPDRIKNAMLTNLADTFKSAEENNVSVKKTINDVKVIDQRSTLTKMIDLTRALFNQRDTSFKRFKRRLIACEFPTPIAIDGIARYPTETLPWKDQESNGLYLFIHGLRGSPTDWSSYTERITDATIFTPNVFAKGDISLEKAAEPILEAVRDYLREHPGKPVQIFGTSNGSRIATYIENHLSTEELGDSSLRIVSVAGVLKGTKIVNFLEKYHLAFLAGLDPELQQEFKWESAVAKNILTEWHNKQRIWEENNKDVRHLFCATLEDEQVWPIASSFLNSSHTVNSHKIFSGQTHISIVEEACNMVFDWLDKNKAEEALS